MDSYPRDRAMTAWLRARADRWLKLNTLIDHQRDHRDENLEDARNLVKGFRALVRDLSLARSAVPHSKLTQQLEALCLKAHEAIYRSPSHLRRQLIGLIADDVPRVVRALRGSIIFTALLFLSSAVSGWLLVTQYPELVSLFASETMINKVQRGELWTKDLLNVVPSSLLSLSIMTNNIFVTLSAFVCGALYGLGTIYIIGINGLMLGGAFALTAQYHMEDQLITFVIAHGVVELSVVCIAGAAGIRLGEALAHPGDCLRVDAFREAVTEASKLLPVCAIFLVGAGLIEGYVSPDKGFPVASRVLIGLSYGVLLWLVLTGRAFRRAKLH
ncbi:MAG TPA: stage II sporulation protein M [Nitrospira sp.]|nr:stage II sporulation protein M [Nitrospira sp.]